MRALNRKERREEWKKQVWDLLRQYPLWLETQPPGAIVGYARSGYDCPLARFIAENTHLPGRVSVSVSGQIVLQEIEEGYGSLHEILIGDFCYDENPLRMPEWLIRLERATEDTFGGSDRPGRTWEDFPVTAEGVLSLYRTLCGVVV